MKKYVLLFAFLSFQISLYSQKEPPYFPQEQLIYSDCDETNPSACLYEKVGEKVKSLLSEALQKYPASEDTLKVRISFSVNKKGVINEGNYTTLNDSLLYTKTKDPLKAIIYDFQPFEVLNRKPKEYKSSHRLNYLFTLSKTPDSTLSLTSIPLENNPYEGGQIWEVPIYAKCRPKTDKQARECFQKSIQAHIRENFRYPEEAQELGMQVKVAIIFVIDKDGFVTNIRTRGPHEILEEEAHRIASLIPRMTPGKVNGKPVKVPFSIPITFRLR